MMKRFLMFTLMLLLLFSSVQVVNAADLQASKTTDEIKASVKSELRDGVKYYQLFECNGYSINLYPESAHTKEEAVSKYSKAIKFIANDLTGTGIPNDLDNEQFQEAIKGYFLIELEDKVLQKEITEFASFMDFYENKAINNRILSEVKGKKISTKELNLMQPAKSNSTKNSSRVTKSDQLIVITSTYSGSTAATYATNWWNKTNNTDYPYYATYYGQSTSTNDLNDLPSGATGQSDPRRAWNDCTNFVSQAIYAGGIPTIKSGLILPHTKVENWYYSDDKPSHTWGGAPNFYQHFSARAGVAASSSDLQVGDAVSVDFTGDGSVDHTILITKMTGTTSNKQFVTYHTYDTNQTKTLEYFYNYNANVKIYGYEMDKI